MMNQKRTLAMFTTQMAYVYVRPEKDVHDGRLTP
jgi:hypothetical protein